MYIWQKGKFVKTDGIEPEEREQEQEKQKPIKPKGGASAE